jgi:hypothetical protein
MAPQLFDRSNKLQDPSTIICWPDIDSDNITLDQHASAVAAGLEGAKANTALSICRGKITGRTPVTTEATAADMVDASAQCKVLDMKSTIIFTDDDDDVANETCPDEKLPAMVKGSWIEAEIEFNWSIKREFEKGNGTTTTDTFTLLSFPQITPTKRTELSS